MLTPFPYRLANLPRQIEFVRELEGFDGPILSEYKAVQGSGRYLEKWCAQAGGISRWLVVRSDGRAIAEYLDGRMSMLDLLRRPNDDAGFIVDRAGDAIINVYLVSVAELPPSYLPKPMAMHDLTLRPEWDMATHSFLLGQNWDAQLFATLERRYLDVFSMTYFTEPNKGRQIPSVTLDYDYNRGFPIVSAFRRIRTGVPVEQRARSAGVAAESPGVLTMESPSATAQHLSVVLSSLADNADEYSALYKWSRLKPSKIEHLPAEAFEQLAKLCDGLHVELKSILPDERKSDPLAILTAGKLVAAYYRRLWGLLEPDGDIEFIGAGVERSGTAPTSIYEEDDEDE